MEKDIVDFKIENVDKIGENDDNIERTNINQSPVSFNNNLNSNINSNNNNNNNGNNNGYTTNNYLNSGINNSIENTNKNINRNMVNTGGAIANRGNTYNNYNSRGISQKNNGDSFRKYLNKNASEALKNKNVQKALSKVNPVLGAGAKVLSKMNNGKKENNLDSNNIDPSNSNSNNNSSLTEVVATAKGMTMKKKIIIGLISCAPMLLCFICIVTISVVIISKIGGLKLSDNVSATETDIYDTLRDDADQSTDDDFDADIESAYLDRFFDDNNDDYVPIILVAKNNDLNFDNMKGLFGGNTSCNPESGNCIEDADKRFFLKMYDLYYLYLTKYNVELDLPLLMATLTYNSTDLPETFTMNLSYYNRKLIVDSDWNPKETTELDWDYDYKNAFRMLNFDEEQYIFANDSAYDMQILAKNMVSKTTEQSCVKTDDDNDTKVTTKSKKVVDDEMLECGEDEELVIGISSYSLDLDKYNIFLLEYIEKKFYDKSYVLIPAYYNGYGEIYQTDKVPSIISKRKKITNTSSSNNKSNTSIKNDSPSSSTIITTPGGFKGKIHYYNQGDYYAYSFGGYGSIQSHGCGPTSLAIVISSLLNEEHSPVEVTNKLCELGGCTSSGATLWSIKATAEAYGLNVDYNSNTQDVIKALKSGKALVVAITNGGLIISDRVQLSEGGHYIVLTGVDSNGQITIADPGNSANNYRTLDLEKLSFNSNNRPELPSFWIITK